MGVLSAFYTKDIDLTTAHDNLEVVVGDFAWVQFWCDGAPHGITVAVETQAGDKAYLNRFTAIPIRAGSKVYVTNDVRSGRSTLQLIFSRTTPLHPYLGGEGITREELAARLGSIQTFDRRGEVVWLDDFEQGIGRWFRETGTVTASSTESKSGTTSVKLVTAATAGEQATISRRVAVPNLSKTGFEMSFQLPGSNLRRAAILGYHYDGTNVYTWGLAYDAANSEFEYYNNGWVSFATSVTLSGGLTGLFNTFKVVFDLSSHRYVRAVLNTSQYDLSPYNLQSGLSAVAASLQVQAQIITNADAAITGYVDDAIVTQNEPG